MAELTYDSLDPGDELTGASLTSRFTSITTVVNDLDVVTFAPGALNENHLASGVSASGTQVRTGTVQYTNLSTGSRDYDVSPAALNGTNTSGVFDVINIGGNLEVDLGALQILGGVVGGVLVIADINLDVIERLNPPSGAPYSPREHMVGQFAAFRIEGSINGSSWTSIAKSQRVVEDGYRNAGSGVGIPDQKFKVGLRTLITATEMAAGGRYVRVVVSVGGSTNPATCRITLGLSRLAVLSLRSTKV